MFHSNLKTQHKLSFDVTGPPPLPGPRRHFVRWAGVAAGILYGIFFRFYHAYLVFDLMSKAFLFGVPFVLGFVQVYISEKYGPRRWWERLTMPWVPALLCLAASMIFFWEGLICAVLFAPLTLVLSSLGGIAAGIVRDAVHPQRRNLVFLCCLMLPVAIAPVENLRPPQEQMRTVATAIEIDAPPAILWDQIKSVPAIRVSELRDSWTHRIGFPRPVQATLSHEGIGGVRRATFEGGVLFIETVTRWDPPHRLAFTIHAGTASIPPGTLDEHVTIGGPYFDVLEGEYIIEPSAGNRTTLRLSSRHRLSTRFNSYAALWSDAILRDIQEEILLVIKHRCEQTYRN